MLWRSRERISSCPPTFSQGFHGFALCNLCLLSIFVCHLRCQIIYLSHSSSFIVYYKKMDEYLLTKMTAISPMLLSSLSVVLRNQQMKTSKTIWASKLEGIYPFRGNRKKQYKVALKHVLLVQWRPHGWFPCSSCDGLVSCKHISGLCLLTVRSTHMAHSRSNNEA